MMLTAAALALVLAGAAAAGEAVPARLTLADCLRLGEQRALDLAVARREQGVADADILQVRAMALPTMTAEGRYTRLGDPPTFPGAETDPLAENMRAAVTANQLLFSGGAVRAALRAAGSYRNVAYWEAERVRRQLVRNIAVTFYDVLYAEGAVEVAQASFDLLEEYAAQTAQRAGQGLASEFERLTASVRVANERPRVARARNTLALTRTALRDLMNIDAADYRLVGALTAPTNVVARSSLQAQAIAERPEMLAARAGVRLREAECKVADAAYWPELRAYALYAGDRPNQYDPSSDAWLWDWQAGVTAAWDIFDGGLRRGKRRAARLKAANAVDAVAQWEDRVRREVEEAALNLDHARELLSGTEETVALAERALAIARARVEQGMATYIELTDANVALSEARLTRLDALRACRQAWIELQVAAGGELSAARLGGQEEGSDDE